MELVVSTSFEVQQNLAMEEFLFSRCSGEYAFFYVNDPCVVIGSNQVWRNEVDEVFCQENQIPVVRRISGGGAVYHDHGNLNYSFISHKTADISGTGSDFLLPVVEALASLGVEALIGKRKDLWLPNGYKISGTASHVTMNRVLQHGTLLYDTNIEMLHGTLSPRSSSLTVKGIPSVPSPVMNIERYLSEFSEDNHLNARGASAFFKEFINVIARVLKAEAGFTFGEDAYTKIAAIRADRYDTKSWNLRK